MFGKRKAAREKDSALALSESIASAKPVQQDAALIAVIAAAIAASLGTSSNGIVIRSLKRSSQNTPKWGVAGKEQQIYHQF